MAAAITLTTAQKAQITQLAVLYEKGNAGKASVDDTTASELDKIFAGKATWPTSGKNDFMDNLREAPVATFLRIILSIAP